MSLLAVLCSSAAQRGRLCASTRGGSALLLVAVAAVLGIGCGADSDGAAGEGDGVSRGCEQALGRFERSAQAETRLVRLDLQTGVSEDATADLASELESRDNVENAEIVSAAAARAAAQALPGTDPKLREQIAERPVAATIRVRVASRRAAEQVVKSYTGDSRVSGVAWSGGSGDLGKLMRDTRKRARAGTFGRDCARIGAPASFGIIRTPEGDPTSTTGEALPAR